MLMNGYAERFKKIGEPISWETDATKDGCAIYTRFFSSERYGIDFADDFTSEGWLQFDTDQDAPYFGVWVNPRLFLTLTYAEGDWSLVECPDRERYNRVINTMIEFYGEGFVAIAIDIDAKTKTTYRQDRTEFYTEGSA